MRFDFKEYIDVLPGIGISELKQIILSGDMMLPSVQTCIMALNALKMV
jgi:hypothetical protein